MAGGSFIYPRQSYINGEPPRARAVGRPHTARRPLGGRTDADGCTPLDAPDSHADATRYTRLYEPQPTLPTTADTGT